MRRPQAGVGVDLEGWRVIGPRAARFYLRPDERGDLLRLWTVKEALFKSTPGNEGAAFLDYGVEDPDALDGAAVDRHGRASGT